MTADLNLSIAFDSTARGYHAEIAALTWFSLFFCLLAIVVTALIAFRAGRRAWRTFGAFSRVTAAAGEETTRRVAEIDARTQALAASTARLDAAKARLQRSLAELAVLTDAAGETGALVRGVRGAVPRK